MNTLKLINGKVEHSILLIIVPFVVNDVIRCSFILRTSFTNDFESIDEVTTFILLDLV